MRHHHAKPYDLASAHVGDRVTVVTEEPAPIATTGTVTEIYDAADGTRTLVLQQWPTP